MIKVLFAPLNFGDAIQSGVCDAFHEAGAEVEVFDYFYFQEQIHKTVPEIRRLFLQKAVEFQPHLIHLQIQHTTILDHFTIATVKQLLPNTIISNWTSDVRSYLPETYKRIAEVADHNFISSTGQIEMFSNAIGKPVRYWQIGYNPKFYYPPTHRSNKFEWDVCFIANHNSIENYPGRAEREFICKLLRKHYGPRFALFGTGWPSEYGSNGSLDQRTLASTYHKSFSVLSVSHFNDLNHYFSDRLLMCMASGRPTISYRFPRWESYFTNNCDLVIAETLQEIPNKINFLLRNIELAHHIGESGADKVFAEHTYFSRVNELLELVGLR